MLEAIKPSSIKPDNEYLTRATKPDNQQLVDPSLMIQCALGDWVFRGPALSRSFYVSGSLHMLRLILLLMVDSRGEGALFCQGFLLPLISYDCRVYT